MTQLRLTWSEFKSFVEDKDLKMQYTESNTGYFIFALEGSLMYLVKFAKDGSDGLSSDLSDFETNYKDISTNTAHVANVRIEGGGTRKIAEVDNSNRLLVSTLPVPPENTTPVSQISGGSNSTTVDLNYLIPNGQAVTITSFSGTGQSDSDGTAIEILYDPLGTGVGMTRIDIGIVSGNDFQHPLEESFVGDGTALIRLRRRRLTGGAVETWGRWSGYVT